MQEQSPEQTTWKMANITRRKPLLTCALKPRYCHASNHRRGASASATKKSLVALVRVPSDTKPFMRLTLLSFSVLSAFCLNASTPVLNPHAFCVLAQQYICFEYPPASNKAPLHDALNASNGACIPAGYIQRDKLSERPLSELVHECLPPLRWRKQAQRINCSG